MDNYEITSKIDHTNLNVCATEEDIIELCEEAIKYRAASVCVAPMYIRFARDYFYEHADKDHTPRVCTVIGFPNGYSTVQTKGFEFTDAINKGAQELDVVINICDLKNKKYNKIENELLAFATICHKLIPNTCRKTLKVIVETCLLTEEEKIKMCEICMNAGVDYIKTSTGFSKAGAKIEDVKLFRKVIGNHPLKIKASGGISGIEDAIKFIEAGADRLGTSKVIKEMIKNDNLNIL